MPLLHFLIKAIIISLSGVMAPGPITAVTVGKGNESPHAGAWIAIGHGIVEFPIMIIIFYGLGNFFNLFYVKAVIGIAGGFFLLLMGFGMIQSLKRDITKDSKYSRSPLIAGIILSIANPYFLVWWATVGATLIIGSKEFGVEGFFIFAVIHWLCDFIWYYFISFISFKGGYFFGKTFQKVIFVICGIFLFYFGGIFIFDAIKTII